MPLATPHATHSRPLTHARSTLARIFLLLCCAPTLAGLPAPVPRHRAYTSAPLSSPLDKYSQAQRMREALEGRPQRERTRRDYNRVLSAFRLVYHDAPHGAHADASVAAVAELLAEQGRIFEAPRSSQDAISQYEFLRRAYPSSPYRYSALLTEGEIYSRDLNDRVAARAIFAEFLKLYPQNALADQARQELKSMRAEPDRRRELSHVQQAPSSSPAALASPSGHTVRNHHSVVLDAARASQIAQPPSGATQPSGQTRAGPAYANAPAQRGAVPSLSASKPSPPANVGSGTGRSTLIERDLPASGSAAAQASAGTVPSLSGTGTGPASTVRPGQEPPPNATLSEAALSAPPPSRRHGSLPLVTGVRHWSTAVYTRVAIDLDDEVQYEASRVPDPDRIFFDLHGARLSPELVGKAVTVTDGGYLKRIRAAQFSNDMVRVVLDVSDVSEFSAFFLPNPSRLIIDIHGTAPGKTTVPIRRIAALGAPSPNAAASASPSATPRPAMQGSTAGGAPSSSAMPATGSAARPVSGFGAGSAIRQQSPSIAPIMPPAAQVGGAGTTVQPKERTHSATSANRPTATDTLGDIATLDRQPNTIRATRSPTTAPVAASVADTTPAPQPGSVLAPAPDLTTRRVRPTQAVAKATRAHGITPADTPAPAIHAPDPPAGQVRAAAPTATGERSMVRALGLKIGRIVVDAGHGGHDSGTLGPGGIEEKEIVLDVALRLGRLLKQRLGADVIYTRDDDTFIPLETRTAIANKAQADLFISVHANSSPDASARGVETYYLNFTSSADALEVAARENAVSDQSIHQLSDLVKKITLQDKLAESREFAGDVEQSLYTGLETGNPGLKDRGVKKAPFVVLIGANMPSILAEISFLTNPEDARQLRDGEYRQRIAESLYRGVAKYIGSLSGVRLAEGSPRPTGQ